MDNNNLNLEWSYRIADILYQLGARYACICPGLRNSPLTIGFTDNNNYTSTSHIDERSAGFFGLGISKGNNLPTIVITTSGTATANLLPSIIESSLSKTPLIVITADRPEYLIDKGENQTINQKNIYGVYVRDFIDLGLPSQNYSNLSDQLVSIYTKCMGEDQPPGPIHINTPFEEPLVTKLLENYESSISIKPPSKNYSNNDVFIHINTKNALIICGEISKNENLDSILEISEHINAPILADPTSNLRYFKHHDHIISNYNLFLNGDDYKPDVIIRFGRKPTSKLLNNLINNHNNVILVDEYPEFNDESDISINSNYNNFLKYIKSLPKVNDNNCLYLLSSKQKSITSYLNKLNSNEYNCEGILTKEILNHVKPNTNIFIGNSMAIRQMDDLTTNLDKRINIFSNRGASGIDGLVSTALGVSYESSKNQQENIAILGDLSFYHDMNGLIFALNHQIRMKFIILNNNGGGIFSSHDIEKLSYPKFKEFWTTPLNLDIEKIAHLYNINYSELHSANDVKTVLSSNNEIEIIDYKISIDSSKDVKAQILKEIEELTII